MSEGEAKKNINFIKHKHRKRSTHYETAWQKKKLL